ncbi:MAG TPA: MGMT family protein [Candidatus Absconditabacterales bacterium]|nr:MGMT family protein [Candidatus Absconditabacterales bacterium]HMT26881.1 MGMT family protein [Candidatus Absconditabacterales bacterium]
MKTQKNSLRELVYEFLRKIPKGKVVTYKMLAEKFQSHPRAIGRLIGKNHEQEKYPCYKVVGSDGSLRGYNLGLPEKISRLEKDGIVVENGKVASTLFWIAK